MSIKLNKEQYEKLKRYEKWFKSSIEQGYADPLATLHKQIMIDVYREVLGKKVNINMTCPACMLDLYKKLGKLYFEYVPKGRPRRL